MFDDILDREVQRGKNGWDILIRKVIIFWLNPRISKIKCIISVLWFSTYAGKIGPFCVLGTFYIGPAKKIYPFGHVLNPLLTELVQNRFKVYKWIKLYGLWKIWKVMNLRISLSRNLIVGLWEPWKIKVMFGKLILLQMSKQGQRKIETSKYKSMNSMHFSGHQNLHLLH